MAERKEDMVRDCKMTGVEYTMITVPADIREKFKLTSTDEVRVEFIGKIKREVTNQDGT